MTEIKLLKESRQQNKKWSRNVKLSKKYSKFTIQVRKKKPVTIRLLTKNKNKSTLS